MSELELIEHPQIEGFSMFFDTVDYRTAHFHPEWELIWVLVNPLAVSFGQNMYRAVPGDLVLFNPYQPHEFHKTDAGCTFLCMQVSPALLNGLPGLANLRVDTPFPQPYLTPKTQHSLQDALLAMMDAYLERQAHYELFCVGQAYLVLHRLFSAMPCRVFSAGELAGLERRNARLKRLLNFVDENYMHKVCLKDFAEQEGVSLYYLSGFVKETLDQNFQTYVDTVRFHCACKLIAAGGMKLLDVCMASGFSDYRYFVRAFRRRMGVTPEQYRRSRPAGQPLVQEADKVHHSLHSFERFYSCDTSKRLLQTFREQRGQPA